MFAITVEIEGQKEQLFGLYPTEGGAIISLDMLRERASNLSVGSLKKTHLRVIGKDCRVRTQSTFLGSCLAYSFKSAKRKA